MTVDEYRIILAIRSNEFSPEFMDLLNKEAERVQPLLWRRRICEN